MYRSFLRPVALTRAARVTRSTGAAYHAQDQELAKLFKLKQPHELPKDGRARVWRDEPIPLKLKVAFGLLGVAMVGVIIYEVDRYRNVLRPEARRILDAREFSSFTLTSKEPVTGRCSIFTLRPVADRKSAADPYGELWLSSVWSVQAKQPQLQIARSYTPLPPTRYFVPTDPDACSLRLLIREETNGEMSGYLHRLGVGAEVELRGPHVECAIPKDVDEIVFFAGGTGIAPALQVAHYLSKLPPGSGKAPRMKLVWSSRRREDCAGGVNDTIEPATLSGGKSALFGLFKTGQSGADPKQQSLIVQELERLKALYTGRLKVDYYVDEENTFVDDAAIRRHLANASDDIDPAEIKKAVMVSGPDGFVNHLAGAKIWTNGHEQQGRLGGLLQTAIQPHWTVTKL